MSLGLYLVRVLTEQTEQTHADEHAQTEDCSLVTQEAAQNNNALVDDLRSLGSPNHRYGGSCSYPTHETHLGVTTVVGDISDDRTGQREHNRTRGSRSQRSRPVEMESIDHLPIPGAMQRRSRRKNAPAKIIGIWYAMDCAIGMKETQCVASNRLVT